jgi:REP element-mobilizing transposase RayT
MNRGHNREAVFADADDCRYFLDLLERYKKRFPLRIFHYCLLTNHFHLLVQMPTAQALSACLAGLLRSYVHYFNRRHGFVGHLWQGRFKSPAVEVEAYFLSCARYIERNPVAAGLVTLPWKYEWSSCRAYAAPMLLAWPTGCWRTMCGIKSWLQSRRCGSSVGGNFCWVTIPRKNSSGGTIGLWARMRIGAGCKCRKRARRAAGVAGRGNRRRAPRGFFRNSMRAWRMHRLSPNSGMALT